MDAASFMERVEIRSNGCWYWTGSIDGDGYGRLWLGDRRRSVRAHRLAYEIFTGSIPRGLCIDHVCHNEDPDCNLNERCLHRRCVNPEHLDAVTVGVNVLRGKGPPARRARSDSCDKGHALAGDNLILKPDGHRQCRECERESQRRRARTPSRVARQARYVASGKEKAARAARRERIGEDAFLSARREAVRRYRARQRVILGEVAFRAKQRDEKRAYIARRIDAEEVEVA